jgi:hypothetical protein
MMAFAPGRFSKMIGWPSASEIFCPTVRAIRSV